MKKPNHSNWIPAAVFTTLFATLSPLFYQVYNTNSLFGVPFLPPPKQTAKYDFKQTTLSTDDKIKILSDFAAPTDKNIQRESIADLLYDVYYIKYGDKKVFQEISQKRIGDATYIGGNFFLSSYHVVNEEKPYLRLVCQNDFPYHPSSQAEFEIVHHDKELDVALLESKGMPLEEHAVINLSNASVNIGDHMSSFEALKREREASTYTLPLTGLNIYEQETTTNLGVLTMPKGSHLLEKQGWAVERNDDKLDDILGDPAHEKFRLMSIPSHHGDSGKSVFKMNHQENYQLQGVIQMAASLAYMIETPDNPEGYDAFQQTYTYFADAPEIRGFINDYITKLEQSKTNSTF